VQKTTWLMLLVGVLACLGVSASASKARSQETIAAFIYYKVDDKAFERAAKTHADTISGSTKLMKEVSTKQDFLDAWEQINSLASQGNKNVKEVFLFTHASKQSDQQDGLEFSSLDGTSGTLKREDITALKKLPWASNSAQLVIFGCNTGLRGTRGWCPAEHFAQTQAVTTIGETGYSYFSKSQSSYEVQSASDNTIYLHAYKRGKNGALGDGSLIATKTYHPLLTACVGDGCPNNPDEVKTIQKLLNSVPTDKGGPTPPLNVDGLIGPNTVAAIKKFQQHHLSFQDGKIEPGKATLIKLLEFKAD
jgi:lysozyme family protein